MNSDAIHPRRPRFLRAGLVAVGAAILTLGGVGTYELIHPAHAAAINGEEGLTCVYWWGVQLRCWMGG